MAKKITLTPTALASYDKILEYLIKNWGITVANDFIRRFMEVNNVLSKDAQIYPFENKLKKVQRCLITKHNIAFFRESDTSVEILMIFDTRQDPKKLAKLLNKIR